MHLKKKLEAEIERAEKDYERVLEERDSAIGMLEETASNKHPCT